MYKYYFCKFIYAWLHACSQYIKNSLKYCGLVTRLEILWIKRKLVTGFYIKKINFVSKNISNFKFILCNPRIPQQWYQYFQNEFYCEKLWKNILVLFVHMVTSALNTGINFGTKFLQTRNFWIHQILLYIKDHYH